MKKRTLAFWLLLSLTLTMVCVSACTGSRKAGYETCPHF